MMNYRWSYREKLISGKAVSLAPIPQLPLHLLAGLAILISIAIMTVSMIVLPQNKGAAHNPFSTYDAVLPGQPARNMAERGFKCSPAESPYDYHNGFGVAECTLPLATGSFSSVGAVVSGNDILHTSFWVRPNTLRAGDLILLWGAPQMREYSASVYLFWHSPGIVAIASRDGGNYTLFYPVWRVYFFDPKKGMFSY